MQKEYYQYLQEINKAKETIALLEEKLNEIRLKLMESPINADYLKELKRTTLDMTITLNELEHSEYKLSENKLQSQKLEERYND